MTLTQILPATDDIESLDFEPTCSARIPIWNPVCGKPAQWIHRKHCGHVSFMCTECVEQLKKRERTYIDFRCRPCGARWSSFTSSGVLQPL